MKARVGHAGEGGSADGLAGDEPKKDLDHALVGDEVQAFAVILRLRVRRR
jgi:hypothetical protein